MAHVKDFADILRAFREHCVDHAVFGAQAMIAHGVTRYTGASTSGSDLHVPTSSG